MERADELNWETANVDEGEENYPHPHNDRGIGPSANTVTGKKFRSSETSYKMAAAVETKWRQDLLMED